MAATLPAIRMAPGKNTGPAIQQHTLMSPAENVHGTSKSQNGVVLKRTQGKQEQLYQQKILALRGQLPALTQTQTAKYKNTYKHNLCLDMLQDGFHRSFTELFALIKRQSDERLRAGPDSFLWNQTLLTEEHEKLDAIKQHLIAAETAMLKDNYLQVYKSHFELARYFQDTADKWLADHFFQNCLHWSTKVQGDEGKVAAEGHCNVGLSLEESGNLQAAAENFELFYALTNNKPDWSTEDGTQMHSLSCQHLTRIYTAIAEQYKSRGDKETGLEYLTQAYNMAKEGRDSSLFGEASYRLGVAYEKIGDSETALLYLHSYLETCRTLNDSKGIGKACEAIAKSHDSQGHVDESIKYLEMYIQVAEQSKDDKALSHACNSLGAMFNLLGRYEQAVEYFNRSYSVARSLSDAGSVSSSRVLYGTALAHKMLHNYVAHVQTPTRLCLSRLQDWKDNRGDEFDKPIPQPVVEEQVLPGEPEQPDST